MRWTDGRATTPVDVDADPDTSLVRNHNPYYIQALLRVILTLAFLLLLPYALTRARCHADRIPSPGPGSSPTLSDASSPNLIMVGVRVGVRLKARARAGVRVRVRVRTIFERRSGDRTRVVRVRVRVRTFFLSNLF